MVHKIAARCVIAPTLVTDGCTDAPAGVLTVIPSRPRVGLPPVANSGCHRRRGGAAVPTPPGSGGRNTPVVLGRRPARAAMLLVASSTRRVGYEVISSVALTTSANTLRAASGARKRTKTAAA